MSSYKKQNRRPLRKKSILKSIDFKMFSCNAAGLKNKLLSLSKVINDLNLSVFCIQETHLVKEGCIEFQNGTSFQIFEKLRETRFGGGLAIGARHELHPVWLGDGGCDAEALTIQITIQEMKIRIVNAYGPQEYDENQRKAKFWKHLDTEVFNAEKNGEAVILTMDGNSWLGPGILKNDPHSQNKNGELMANFLTRNQNLTLLNAESFCNGLITRSRKVNQKEERSAIDFVIVSKKLIHFVNKFTIDENKIFSLINFSSKGKPTYSDHNSILTEMNIRYEKLRPERRLITNFKSEEGFRNYKHETSQKGFFSEIFTKNISFKKQLKLWNHRLTSVVNRCFKKVRIKKDKRFVCKTFKKRKKAIVEGNISLKNAIEKDLQEEDAKGNMSKLIFNIKALGDVTNGKQRSIWKVKNKFFPKIKTTVPEAKRNLANKIITNPTELKKLYVKHFQHRMRPRPMLNKFKKYETQINQKFESILLFTRENCFPDWTVNDLEIVLKSLKRSQSQDSMGFINEMFMLENVGDDLKISMVYLFNNIKNQNEIPYFFRNVYVTAIPKKKKSPLDLINLRGIFLVPKLRGIFMKLIYNSIIDIIEDNLSSSNIGARRKKSPRDHLFVTHSVVHETLNEKDVHDIDLVFYDVAQAYDSLWVTHTLVDLFENDVQSNLLNVIHEISKTANISVKTPVGISSSKEIEETIMQGETLSSILCTNSVDKIAKDCNLDPFKYKKDVDIPKMGFVDDILDINKCGKETKEMNEYTRTEINKRRLQLSATKCVRLHIKAKNSSETSNCESIAIDGWKEETYEEDSKHKVRDVHMGETEIETVSHHLYLGSVIQEDGSNMLTIRARAAKGRGILRDIVHILEGTFFGSSYFEALKLLRESMLMSVITHNLEVSFNLTARDLKILHDIDIQLLRGCLKVGSKSSHCLLLLELGLLSVEFLIKKKRILYLFHLLTTDTSSLVSQVFQKQMISSVKGDWVDTVLKDLRDFDIKHSFHEISIMSKSQFKNIVTKAGDEACLNALLKEKERLSKGSEICYRELKTQPYLLSPSGLSAEEMRRIYHIRTRELPLKANYPAANKDRDCLFPGCTSEDSQMHLYQSSCFSDKTTVQCREVAYKDIFGSNIRKQIIVMQLIFSKLQERAKYLPQSNRGLPADPRQKTNFVTLGIQKAKLKHKKNIMR